MTLETANRLYELRKKHNLSQEELAEKLGVSRQAVSKWERSEASPDTDNIIALAKIYGLTLDELIYGEKEKAEKDVNNEEAKDESKEEKQKSDDEDETVFINVDDGKDKVKIGPQGIVVEDEDGEKVKIGWSGIKVETSCRDDDDDDDDFDIQPTISVEEDGHVRIHIGKEKKQGFWLSLPYSIICTVMYLWFGFEDICGGWGSAWIIFLTIPVYYTFFEAIYKRRMSEFAYPVLVTCVYFYLGVYHSWWHPYWLIFLTVPIFYPIAEFFDKKLKKNK